MTVEVHHAMADGVVLLTIDRPATRNAVSQAVIAQFSDALDTVEANLDQVGVVAIRGAGDRVFVSGGDLKELARIRSVDAATEMALAMRTVLDRLASLPVPTVALLNGDAYGGGAEVAIACDMRVAADHARLGFTQVRLGIMPAWGGVERLTTLVGRGRASYLLLSGRVLDATQALALGLVEEVVPRARFDERCRSLLADLAQIPASPRRAIKSLVSEVGTAVFESTRQTAVACFAEAWVADEHWSAVAAARPERGGGAAKIAADLPSRGSG